MSCFISPALEISKSNLDFVLGNLLEQGGWTSRPPELPSNPNSSVRQNPPQLTEHRCSGGNLDKISGTKCSSCFYTDKIEIIQTTYLLFITWPDSQLKAAVFYYR